MKIRSIQLIIIPDVPFEKLIENVNELQYGHGNGQGDDEIFELIINVENDELHFKLFCVIYDLEHLIRMDECYESDLYQLYHNNDNINSNRSLDELKDYKKIFESSLDFIKKKLREDIIQNIREEHLKNDLNIRKVLEICNSIVESWIYDKEEQIKDMLKKYDL